VASGRGFAVAPGFTQGLHWRGLRIDADVNCLQAFCLSLLGRQVSARVDLSTTSCTGTRWLCSVTLNNCTCVGETEEADRNYMALYKTRYLCVCMRARACIYIYIYIYVCVCMYVYTVYIYIYML